MELWINIIFAWVALALSFLLIVIWALRLITKQKKITWITKLNRALRKRHKLIGILLIAVALVHGLFSSDAVLSLNWGTANWVVSIMLGLSWLLRKKLNLKKWWMYIHRALTVAFVGLLVVHILNVGGFILDDMIAGRIQQPPTVIVVQEEQPSPSQETEMPTSTEESGFDAYEPLPTLPPNTEATAMPTQKPTTQPTATPVPTDEATAGKYMDGTYEGTATGFQPGLVVEVAIENGVIASVTVTDHNEINERFWGYPVEVVPQWIVESQSTDVDIVSGATYTSQGIMDAVDDALSKAMIN